MRYLRILAVLAAWGFLGYMALTAERIPLDPDCLKIHTAYECSFYTRAKNLAG